MRTCSHLLFSGFIATCHEVLGDIIIARSLGTPWSAHEVVNVRIIACSLGTPRRAVLHLLAFSYVFSITALTAQPNFAEARALGTHIRVATLT